jgi:hypothetical protein
LNEAERRLRLATQTSADQAAAYEVLMAERDRLAERVAWLQSLFPLLGAAPP